MQRFLTAAIQLYQRYLSPFFPASCRYIPSCSEYMLTAIKHHGVRRGLWLGVRRIGRCHPWGGSGYDPVPGCHCADLPTDHPLNQNNSEKQSGTCNHG